MGNEELGIHYQSTGDFQASSRAYTRMRDYCTTQRQLAERDLKLALLSVSQNNYISLQQNVQRVQAAVLSAADAAKIAPCLPPLSGLASLKSGNYRAAAGHFLRTPPAFIRELEPVAGGVLVNRAVLSPNDVATYGTLCALATYSRSDLKSSVLDSPSFRQFLELEPHLRRAVNAFVGAKYTTVLETLDAYRPDYLLDLHLQEHVAALWAMVRRKSIVAFFGPFQRVEVRVMVDAFGGTEASMMQELADMIEQGLLRARLDAVDGVLVAKGVTGGVSERRAVHEKALNMAGEQERAMRLKLMRLQMVECGFEVKASKDDKNGAEYDLDAMDDDDGRGSKGMGTKASRHRGGRGGGGTNTVGSGNFFARGNRSGGGGGGSRGR